MFVRPGPELGRRKKRAYVCLSDLTLRFAIIAAKASLAVYPRLMDQPVLECGH